MLTSVVTAAPAAPVSSSGGPPKLTPEQLKVEQQRTLASPRRRYGLAARCLFALLDAVYGRERTLSKFKVLEVVARVPYQAWEHVAYTAVTHRYSRPAFARRIFKWVDESRQQQDNEQWHLLILEELVEASGRRENCATGCSPRSSPSPTTSSPGCSTCCARRGATG